MTDIFVNPIFIFQDIIDKIFLSQMYAIYLLFPIYIYLRCYITSWKDTSRTDTSWTSINWNVQQSEWPTLVGMTVISLTSIKSNTSLTTTFY